MTNVASLQVTSYRIFFFFLIWKDPNCSLLCLIIINELRIHTWGPKLILIFFFGEDCIALLLHSTSNMVINKPQWSIRTWDSEGKAFGLKKVDQSIFQWVFLMRRTDLQPLCNEFHPNLHTHYCRCTLWLWQSSHSRPLFVHS